MKDLNELFFSIYIEKIENRGEDAEPLIVVGDSSVLLGVFDGLGGAGSIQKYRIDNDTEYKSGAYVASRVTRGVIKWFFNHYNLHRFLELQLNKKEFSFFDSLPLGRERKNNKVMKGYIKEFLNYLEKILTEELIKKENDYADKAKVSMLKSKSVNLLPTTLALLYTTSINSQKVTFSFWAGDSRVYKLNLGGLVQLTCDDIDEVDGSLESINSNAPMNNYINASKPFHINYDFFLESESKQILIASTDGAFGVFDTPLLFELAILNTLQESNGLKMWKSKMQSILKERQNDDISLVIYPVGFKNFDEIKKFYKPRTNLLNSKSRPYINIESDIKILEKQIKSLSYILDEKEVELENMKIREWNGYSNHYLKQIKHHYEEKRREL